MRKGYNHELAVKIQIEKEMREIKTQFDVHGNVIRDHYQEIRVLSEGETNYSLPEIPVAYFDGCKVFKDHFDKSNITPVVREIKLAPLIETKRKFSIMFFMFNILNKSLSFITKRNNNELPIFNKKDESKKVWIYEKMVKKYIFK